MAEFLGPLFEASSPPATLTEVANLYARTLESAIRAWRDGEMSNAQARFLGFFVRHDLLPTEVDASAVLAERVAEYRRLEAEVPVPTRVPGVIEADAFDQPLFLRGNHKQAGDPVSRRFLEAIDATPYTATDSGRLALAQSILDPENPLTARVIVNRLWHYLYGRGLVATTDNFGKMGTEPTHPELLDYLANRFVEDGWSIKRMIRFLATSRTLQLDSVPTAAAREGDPLNDLLSHAHLRRLEAEAIRDSMLQVTDRLDETVYGPTVTGHSDRRSIYVTVHRNSLDGFLSTFDAPDPVSTKGRRDVTNVPAHSLTLMNDPAVLARARDFADRVAAEAEDDSQRIERLFRLALGRRPTDDETKRALQFVAQMEAAGEDTESALHARQAIVLRRQTIAEILDAARQTLYEAYTNNPVRRPAELEEGFQIQDISEELIADRLRARWARVVKLRGELDQYERIAEPADGWDQLAHAIFNMKEFIYVR